MLGGLPLTASKTIFTVTNRLTVVTGMSCLVLDDDDNDVMRSYVTHSLKSILCIQ